MTYRVDEDPATAGPFGEKAFILVKNECVILTAKLRPGQSYPTPRRWKTREAAQKVADVLNQKDSK